MPNATRRNRSNRGFFGRVYALPDHVLGAAENSGKEAAKTVGNIFGRGVSGVRRVGSKVTKHLNSGVGELVGGRRNRSRRNRKNRKNRSNRNRRNRH